MPDVTPLREHDLRSGRYAPAATTSDYIFNQLIPYLGNKRKLLGLIKNAVELTGSRGGVFADLFAGSGVVSRFAKHSGFRVVSNDWEPYSFEINHCFVACDSAPHFQALGGADTAIAYLNSLAPQTGWVAGHLCPRDDRSPEPMSERMFFTRANGAKIDSIREQIAVWDASGSIDSLERSYILAPLIFAASYVSNTSGVFKGFHNGWGGKTRTALYRILSDVVLRAPVLHESVKKCLAWQLDAQDAAQRLSSELGEVEIAYIDPPYNQHPYASNYHVLNSIALWDKPELAKSITPGQKSAIRTDWRDSRRSAYNYSGEAREAFGKLIETIRAKSILISYSTDGIINLRDLLEICSKRGALKYVLKPYKRYRVSTPRMSDKPLNVEFVIVVDTSGRTNGSASQVYDDIMAAETEALRERSN